MPAKAALSLLQLLQQCNGVSGQMETTLSQSRHFQALRSQVSARAFTSPVLLV